MDNIKTITYTEFKKEIESKERVEPVIICPYFNLEGWSAKTVYLSDHVTEITMMTYRRKPSALLIPNKGDVPTSLQPHMETLKRLVRVDAPVLSVFDKHGEKITQLESAS